MNIFGKIFSSSGEQLKSDQQKMLKQLYKEYQSAGLLGSMSFKEFEAAVLRRIDKSELTDMGEAWDEGERLPVRTDLLGKVFGIKSDWRFDTDYILKRASELLRKDNLELSWEVLNTEKARKGGDNCEIKTIELSIRGLKAIHYRYSLLPGLISGINHLLEENKIPMKFIGLQTSGDYYVYIYVSNKTEEMVTSSGLLTISKETDPNSSQQP
ncbi:MAG: hypothetical protein ACM34K_10860 [Bacillota bacterium]